MRCLNTGCQERQYTFIPQLGQAGPNQLDHSIRPLRFHPSAVGGREAARPSITVPPKLRLALEIVRSEGSHLAVGSTQGTRLAGPSFSTARLSFRWVCNPVMMT